MDRLGFNSRCATGLILLTGAFSMNAHGASNVEPIQPESLPPEIASKSDAREWLRWWIFDISPRIAAQLVYDDNVNISSDEMQEDLIWVASPGFTAVAGDPLAPGARLLTLGYTPSFIFYSDHTEFNTIDHAANLSGVWPFSKLTLGFSQTFELSTGGIVDVGNRVERKIFNTGLTSSYELSEKTSFEINARQMITDYQEEGLIGTREWLNENWFNYLLTPKVTTSAGLTVGYVDVDESPGQLYERALLRASYKLTYKIDLTASAGAEMRQYDESPNDIGPVFSLGASYWPREGTTISIQGHRDNRASAYHSGQNYISTGASLSLRQRFQERYFFNVGGSYESSEYESTTIGVAATRSDDYYTVQTGVDATITERWIAGIFFRHRENLSNADDFTFNNSQIGLQTSYQF